MFYSKSPFFDIDSQNKTTINLSDLVCSKHPDWVLDSSDFARECLPAMAELKNGPIVLSGLPVDFTIALSLAAWYTGHPVAFVDPNLAARQQRLLQDSLQPVLWVTASTPLAAVPMQTCLLDLAVDSEGVQFEAWLQASSLDVFQPAHRWGKNDTAIILFTSGSTGQAKGVCHSLENLLFSAELFQQHFEIKQTDKLLNLAPLHTMSGLRGSVFLPLLTGCDVYLEKLPEQLTLILRILSDEKNTVLIVGPALLQALSHTADRLSKLKHLRLILNTGAKLSRDVRKHLWHHFKTPVLDYYGLTETCGLVIAEPRHNYCPEQVTLGKACRDIKAVVIDVNGKEATRGVGELRIYSPALYLGYWGQAPSQRQYVDTKDKVSIDAQGWISYLGRMDRGVKSAATTWLYPEAVEKWLSENFDIDDFAITTVQGTSGGVIRGYLACAIDLCQQTLTEQVAKALGSEYNTTQWRKVSSIPRTALGKIQWAELDNDQTT